MKKLLFILVAALSSILAAEAAVQGGLAWDASPTAGITSYRVYTTPLLSTQAGAFPDGWTVLATVPGNQLNYGPIIFDGLPHAYVVTAVSTFGFESDPSNSVDAPLKPQPVGDLRILIP